MYLVGIGFMLRTAGHWGVQPGLELVGREEAGRGSTSSSRTEQLSGSANLSPTHNWRWARICLQCRRLRFDIWAGKIPAEDNGNPLQYSCLENSMDRGDWWATVLGVAKSQTGLSNQHLPFSFLS